MKTLSTLIIVLLLAVSIGAQTEEAEMTEAMPQTLEVETQMCTGIEGRMPVGPTDTFSDGTEQVWLWMKVTGADDTTAITLVWSHEGEEKARHDLPVNSPSWRTWASKKLLPSWTGDWQVKILNPQGDILKAVDFTVGGEPMMEEEAMEEAEAKPAGTSKPAGDGM
ncbi:DUF2914 domain-containing protein [candidate division GN15 bacterium]|nr:DUF2914 domain-containing protein [candidate division GN15 bacterium]